ncbi:MAG: hypothetical protein UX49_C0026G0011 [Candidatus Wolfebacteria bacterium GW2011_GWC2_46_275]|uniref:Uncharacterized protein n=2 Tax=Candidatus Wolfeibacteriota TaxID=1752735 RepID=A0A0G1U5H2_9BACT|nr:MAG: hypothetical protein UX49_C0026G0011 [Candidatus Wolfebacteria bacterium GW2011_GWC2_46_275]KKU41952.1 MAG: hypothetical protein UX58_C0004G0011 [Candidatus Wolfebacteria bacterium GW2011_GWB2_46_69]KKU54512.1 MAG: hypothetical protein UX76_C0002G0105 [Candidatus Wolfebacteria bacterium GW2011_GWC1_47_103]KKU59839.1 MAG: hypothetical protein UX83_C0002G0126 [Candidatus Wolfebacteria bacterium GW2011_GWE2_47_12]KKU73248.1 MAG: hypothetical protein UX96_C0007G0045 [Candidatus Wolfebacteri
MGASGMPRTHLATHRYKPPALRWRLFCLYAFLDTLYHHCYKKSRTISHTIGGSMGHRILIVGRAISCTMTEHLEAHGIEVKRLQEIKRERFEEELETFKPDGIIFTQMPFTADERQRQRMILETKVIPILVTGSFTWSDCVIARSPHVYFASIVTPDQALAWFKCACQ